LRKSLLMQLALNVVLAIKVDVANHMHEDVVNFCWFTIAFQLIVLEGLVNFYLPLFKFKQIVVKFLGYNIPSPHQIDSSQFWESVKWFKM